MKELQGHTHLLVTCDGACWGNPGPSAIGLAFYDRNQRRLATYSEAIGDATNNVAEYRAVIRAMQLAKEAGARHIAIYGDSKLVLNQVRGTYNCASANLLKHFLEARELRKQFVTCRLEWMPRERNVVADRLATAALEALYPGGSR